jgi:hypothetical protein
MRLAPNRIARPSPDFPVPASFKSKVRYKVPIDYNGVVNRCTSLLNATFARNYLKFENT